MNRFDALSYCYSWIERERYHQRFDRLKLIVDFLAEISTSGSNETRESVVVVILEHVFQDTAIKSVFDSWKDLPQLVPLYLEAADLAEKWSEMGRERHKD